MAVVLLSMKRDVIVSYVASISTTTQLDGGPNPTTTLTNLDPINIYLQYRGFINSKITSLNHHIYIHTSHLHKRSYCKHEQYDTSYNIPKLCRMWQGERYSKGVWWMKYCNAACQMAHRTQHKAECKKLFEVALFQIGKRAAELFDEILFKKPPPREDCPICMLQLPTPSNAIVYQACCGKLICSGCMLGIMCTKMGKIRCPFCRVECL